MHEERKAVFEALLIGIVCGRVGLSYGSDRTQGVWPRGPSIYDSMVFACTPSPGTTRSNFLPRLNASSGYSSISRAR